MFPLLPLPATALFATVVLVILLASLRWLHPDAWAMAVVRGGAIACTACIAIGLALWATGSAALSARGVAMAWTMLVFVVPLSIALAVSGVVRTASALVVRRGAIPVSSVPPGISRRGLLRAGAALLPGASIGASLAGLSAARSPQRIPVVTMRFPDMHGDLHGFRILHLSDLHLGVAMHVGDLDAVLRRVGRPDLCVVTGDLADDHAELEAALELLGRERARFGTFACLGNHEYLHDIDVVRRIYERSAVPLLVDRGVTLAVGDARLYLAGVDDPFYDRSPDFFDRRARRLVAAAPDGAFRLLLSHRPAGFPAAAMHGFDLTLSGHTHGGQLGVLGRSAFERLLPDEFLWGTYAIGDRRLYTTSGFGHWFPFRLGCPTEAPLIHLVCAPSDPVLRSPSRHAS